ncbi:hypothetical protein QRD02_11205 [Aequorivita sp. SDUM287046]|uniref:Uncharacterized protein n=1 Tax=Aequorivita aurantiaca TaxID=3053356 RepID=A0ABT8DHZ5_9FLAO|nr:hypothetical protein [Aequorivita aurantiaca]MDN3724953.1 hypothetical protein [Aequorivita aurantiaca]
MIIKSIWISYDLGIKGDYPNLYAWLDNNNAKEAGNSIAFLNYQYNGGEEDLLDILKADLTKSVNFKPGDRVYVIRMRTDKGIKKVSGKFIIGNRKATPWEGYGQKGEDIIDGDE